MFMLMAIFLVLFYSENCWVLFVSKHVYLLVYWSNLVFELVVMQGWLIVINMFLHQSTRRQLVKSKPKMVFDRNLLIYWSAEFVAYKIF